ncbi:MAG TPA: hypothetical protein DHV37_05820 [Erysipelotrichaceae bacterium]|nr:hypothetical protein [Erysipelotrichaceae bacterium]
MRLNDKVYDVLKWVCLIALPASALLYSAIAKIWGLPYGSEIPATINAVALFIGTLIGISNATIKKEENADG